MDQQGQPLLQEQAAFAHNRHNPVDSRMGFTGSRSGRQPSSEWVAGASWHKPRCQGCS